jgi:hypothetical protein
MVDEGTQEFQESCRLPTKVNKENSRRPAPQLRHRYSFARFSIGSTPLAQRRAANARETTQTAREAVGMVELVVT